MMAISTNLLSSRWHSIVFPNSLFFFRNQLFRTKRYYFLIYTSKNQPTKMTDKREKQQQSLSQLVWSHDLFFYLVMFNNTMSSCKFGRMTIVPRFLFSSAPAVRTKLYNFLTLLKSHPPTGNRAGCYATFVT